MAHIHSIRIFFELLDLGKPSTTVYQEVLFTPPDFSLKLALQQKFLLFIMVFKPSLTFCLYLLFLFANLFPISTSNGATDQLFPLYFKEFAVNFYCVSATV